MYEQDYVSENVQLKKLLVSNPPPTGTPVLRTQPDKKQPYQLPVVNQTSEPSVDGNGREWNGGQPERIVREKTWVAKNQCPKIDLPWRLFIIDTMEDSLFEDAIDILDNRKKYSTRFPGISRQISSSLL